MTMCGCNPDHLRLLRDSAATTHLDPGGTACVERSEVRLLRTAKVGPPVTVQYLRFGPPRGRDEADERGNRRVRMRVRKQASQAYAEEGLT